LPFVNSAAVALERARWLEEERRHREELSRLNQDLEAFAHTVAHDLKQPLGVILGATEFLEKDLETLSVEELREHLRWIRRVGKKMHRMIEELLLLARVRYTEVPREPVAMGDDCGGGPGAAGPPDHRDRRPHRSAGILANRPRVWSMA
jgi:signal transduction histidine kinase